MNNAKTYLGWLWMELANPEFELLLSTFCLILPLRPYEGSVFAVLAVLSVSSVFSSSSLSSSSISKLVKRCGN